MQVHSGVLSQIPRLCVAIDGFGIYVVVIYNERTVVREDTALMCCCWLEWLCVRIYRNFIKFRRLSGTGKLFSNERSTEDGLEERCQ